MLNPFRCCTGGAGAAVEPVAEDILAGDSREWEYAMRRGMQEVIPGVFLGPYAAARRNQVRAERIAQEQPQLVAVSFLVFSSLVQA